jgi:hypothetical protein
MPNPVFPLLLLGLLSLAVGCTPAAPPSQTQAPPVSPEAPTITAPIQKAKQTAVDVKQKAMEREQMNPDTQSQPSPSP